MLLKLVTVIGTVTTEPGVQVDALPKFTEIWAETLVKEVKMAATNNRKPHRYWNPERNFKEKWAYICFMRKV
jgi:hypothetical protein